MITDIMLIIATVAGPLFILIMLLSYRWFWSLIPLSIFTIFWVLWFILPTTVPFSLMDKLWWLILALGTCGLAFGIGSGIRIFKINNKCNPKIEECKF